MWFVQELVKVGVRIICYLWLFMRCIFYFYTANFGYLLVIVVLNFSNDFIFINYLADVDICIYLYSL